MTPGRRLTVERIFGMDRRKLTGLALRKTLEAHRQDHCQLEKVLVRLLLLGRHCPKLHLAFATFYSLLRAAQPSDVKRTAE